MLINTQKTAGFLEDVEGVFKDVLKFPSEVIDFGEDLQKRIESFGTRMSEDVAEQGVGMRGAQIGERIANMIYQNKQFLAVAGIAGVLFLIFRK